MAARSARPPATRPGTCQWLRVPYRNALRGRAAPVAHRRSSDCLCRTPGGLLESFSQSAGRVTLDALAACRAWRTLSAPLMARHVVVMLTTSYPRFSGDGVGSFIEPIAKGVAARGHDVHLVAPWHPAMRRRGPEDGVS